MSSRVSSLNNMLGEELITGGSEGKEGESNTHQGGFHMSPDMVNKVEDEWMEVESDRQGQGGFQRMLHNSDNKVGLSMEIAGRYSTSNSTLVGSSELVHISLVE